MKPAINFLATHIILITHLANIVLLCISIITEMAKKKQKPKKKKADETGNNTLDELKKKIKHQKDALNKIIKNYSDEN